MSSDDNNGTGGGAGQSDRTVMLSIDQGAASDGDATLRGHAAVPDATAPALPAAPVAAPARPSGRLATGQMKPLEVPAPRPASGMRKALPDPSAPSDPAPPATTPKRATGVRAALTVDPDPAVLSQETMLKVPAAPSAPKRATGVRAALTVEPDPAVLSQETVLRAPAPQPPKRATGMRAALNVDPARSIAAGADDDDEETARKAPPDAGETVNGMGEQRHRGFQMMVLAVGLLAGAVLIAKLTLGQGRPSDGNLRLLYPYGAAGGTLPNGRTAPPADELTFTFERAAECAGSPCLVYRAEKPGGGFSMEMAVAPTDDVWQLMPLPPAALPSTSH